MTVAQDFSPALLQSCASQRVIDWAAVAANGLWILGFSLVLAAVGYYDWLARRTGRPFRTLLRERGFRLSSTSGLLLIAIGWGLGQAARWQEKALWFVLASSFGWELARLLRSTDRKRHEGR